MKKKFLGVALSVAMVASLLAGCGSSSDDSAATEAPATDATEAPAADAADAADATKTAEADAANAASGDLIKVGIINNDPNESGYRTANVEDLKAKFTEANGYQASFAYSLKNEEQIASAQKMIQDGVDYLLISAADTSGWDGVLKDAQDN